jgi:DNA-binding beta-propeller fold protein YncE
VGLILLLHTSTGFSASILEYETNLSGASPIIRPSAVTIDTDASSICITDEASRTLDVFDRHGLHRFRTDAISGISTPRDGSIDSRGGFVLTDAVDGHGRTIRRLNFLGEPEAYDPEIPGDNWTPHHLIITKDGHYLSVDRSGLLAKHDALTGALMWKLELADPALERSDLLGRPAEASDGTIYVPSAGLRMILVVSGDGRLMTSFGVPGIKRGELSFPVAVTIGPDQKILALDRMRHRILVFDSSHNFLGESGRLGFAPGDLYHPLAIAGSPDGRVYVAQGYKGRIQVFRVLDTASAPGTSSLSGSADPPGDVPLDE